MSEATPEAGLFRKIAEVMGEVDRVEKRGRNEFHKYDYATEADILDAVRAKLAVRNVAIIPGLTGIDERGYETDKGKHSVVTTARVAYTFVCGDTGAMFKTEWAGQGDDPADKGLYKAFTGSEKSFLLKTFLISTGDDPEGDTSTDERSQDRAPARGRQVGKASGKPSEPQVKLIKTLVTKSKATQAQLRIVLDRIGADNVELKEGWIDRLSAGKEGTASKLITFLKEQPLPDPDHPSDVPSDFEIPEGAETLDDVLKEGNAGLEEAA